MIDRLISHYRVLEKIGEGGMGEVYLAEDTLLHRKVALKFLPPHLQQDDISMKRLLREAQSAALLDHPFICHINEVSKTDGGQAFIAMEYVEGKTLQAQLAQGPFLLKDALRIGVEIAEALEFAHQRGIAHRDLKPSNIMQTPQGHSKVMDFGLAKKVVQDDGIEQDVTTTLTGEGSTPGTLAYMSPEQIRSERVDTRTDIFSFGIILYELVAGVHPFRKATPVRTTDAILNEEAAPLSGYAEGTAVLLQHTLDKMLAKDPAERYQHVDEIAVDLKALRRELTLGPWNSRRRAVPERSSDRRREPLLSRSHAYRVGVLLLTASLTFLMGRWTNWQTTDLRPPLRKTSLTYSMSIPDAVISPDGRFISFIGNSELWVQDLAQSNPVKIEGTGGAKTPFWSPDSKFIGFAQSDQLKKVSVQGGPPTPLCSMPSPISYRGTWSWDNDVIVFCAWAWELPSRLYGVSTQGGPPEVVFEPPKAMSDYRFFTPSFLPTEFGRRMLLFTCGPETVPGELVVGNVETEDQVSLKRDGYSAVYSPTGHILFQPSRFVSGIWALPITEELIPGEAFPISSTGELPSASLDGTLVYLDRPERGMQLIWRDRSGELRGALGRPQLDIRFIALSRDGKRVAARGTEVQETQKSNLDVWIHEVDRPIKTRFTFHPELDSTPVWSPRGDQIVFCSMREGSEGVFLKSTDGDSEVVTLTATAAPEWPTDWSWDGKYILLDRKDPETNRDLSYFRLHDDGSFEEVPFLRTTFDEKLGKFSRDGRFVAFASNQSGQSEIYVRPFPEGNGQWQISVDGGSQPRWSQDMDEIFYVREGTLFVVPITIEPVFSVEAPRRLFHSEGLIAEDWTHYDVSPDGERFVLAEPLQSEQPTKIQIVQNWFAEFEDRGQ